MNQAPGLLVLLISARNFIHTHTHMHTTSSLAANRS